MTPAIIVNNIIITIIVFAPAFGNFHTAGNLLNHSFFICFVPVVEFSWSILSLLSSIGFVIYTYFILYF